MVPCNGLTHRDDYLSHIYDNHIGSVNVDSTRAGGKGLRVCFYLGSGGAGTPVSPDPSKF